MPEGSPQACRVRDVEDVSCLLALGKGLWETKCPRGPAGPFGQKRGLFADKEEVSFKGYIMALMSL